MNSTISIILAAVASLSRICPDCSYLYFVALIALSYRYYCADNKGTLPGFIVLFTLFTLHWIYIPFTFDDTTKFLAPFAVFILPLYISCYYWAVERFFSMLKSASDSIYPCLRFVLVFALSELCCTHLLTGFPWMNSGYSWATDIVTLQITSVIGINALGIVMLLCAAVIGLALYEYTKTETFDFRKLIFSGAIITTILMFGKYRLSIAKTVYTDTSIRLVQASIPQDIKNSFSNYDDILELNKRLSLQRDKVDLIIWPEACIPWIYSSTSEPVINKYLEEITKKCKYLISGAVVRTLDNLYYNSAIAFSANSSKNIGNIIYNKVHLLPFGEYMPLKEIIGLKSIASVISDFSFGQKKSVQLNGIPKFQTCICYESVFEYEFIREKNTEWILNITNDGWYKTSNENFQHNNISRVLSVEYGLPMVRVNNLGISSVFDAYGRCIKHIPSGQVKALDIKLPACIDDTIYNKTKNLAYILLIVLLYFMYIKRIFCCIY